MSKRTSGLGRGLGDLLADNSPEIRGGATVIRRDDRGEATITPDLADGVENAAEIRAYVGGEAVDEDSLVDKDIFVKNADIEVENTPTRIIIGGNAQEIACEGDKKATFDEFGGAYAAGRAAEAPAAPRRSLKALFKSYK